MKKKNLLIVLLCVMTLSGCHSSHQEPPTAKAAKFLQQAEKETQASAAEKNKPVEIVPVTYNSAQARNPFELPASVKNNKFYPNAILTGLALDSLKLVGVVTHHDKLWAVLRSNDGKLYRVTQGMRVGVQQALLTQITQNQVKFSVEMPVDKAGKEESHEVIMTMQESSQ